MNANRGQMKIAQLLDIPEAESEGIYVEIRLDISPWTLL